MLGAFALTAAPLSAAWAADPQPYTVTLARTGDGAIDAALAASASLVSLRKSAPAGPFALVGRARNDVATLETVLGGFGYYAAQVTVTIDGTPISAPRAAGPARRVAEDRHRPRRRPGLARPAVPPSPRPDRGRARPGRARGVRPPRR